MIDIFFNLLKNDSKIIQLDEKVLEIEKMINNLKETEVEEIYDDFSYSHFIATCKGETYMPLRDSIGMPHKKFEFILDEFQLKAILCIVNNQSVVVSAHTSSGKTAIAEYAIAKCLMEMKNVIYTSPIKALTNQKYRDFKKKFKDVGIITGDVFCNNSARCLVMTTEILHSMLYKRSPVINSIGWVIFDEVQYINDGERGIAWEESIIMMPNNIKCLFLSATISNAVEFARWITVSNMQPCHVITSKIRPVPLIHVTSTFTNFQLTLDMELNGEYKEEGVKVSLPFDNRLCKLLKSNDSINYLQISQIVKTLFEKKLAPAILFTFSIQMIEKVSNNMIGFNFNTPEETEHVAKLCEKYLKYVSREARKVDQVKDFFRLLTYGIGIHHSGLLPILREIVERLFAKGLIKFLFATESVSLGLNLPAKTVVFLKHTKFDSKEFRSITSGEYIQMSGRAGRRGTDKFGISILLVNLKTKMEELVALYQNSSDPLQSAFRITYNMLLSGMEIDQEPKNKINKSFFLFQEASTFREKIQRAKNLLDKYEDINIVMEKETEQSYQYLQQMQKIRHQIRSKTVNWDKIFSCLELGRLVHISTINDYGWGFIASTYTTDDISSETNVKVVVNKNARCSTTSSNIFCQYDESNIDAVVEDIKLADILEISSVIMPIPENIDLPTIKEKYIKSIISMQIKQAEGIPIMDPVNYLNITNPNVSSLFKKLERSKKKLQRISSSFYSVDVFYYMVSEYERKLVIEQELIQAKKEIDDLRCVKLVDNLNARKFLLSKLGYIHNNGSDTVKGRIFRELHFSGDLVLTEMLYGGIFNEMEPASLCAILSCFTAGNVKKKSKLVLPEMFENLYCSISEMQAHIENISESEFKDIKKTEDSNKKYCTNLMVAVYYWTNGASIAFICPLTDVPVGNIVRTIKRIHQLLQYMKNATKFLNNQSLEKKLGKCIKDYRKKIIFAHSLNN